MICSACTTPNPAQARYCLHCGQTMTVGYVCNACHTLLPPNANYCFHCGTIVVTSQQKCERCGANTVAGQIHCGQCGNQLIQITISASDKSSRHISSSEREQLSSQAIIELAETESPTSEQGIVETTSITARPLPAMLPSLKKYLPETLYEPLERRPNERQITIARDHLISLVKTATTYLPRPVVLAPQKAGEPAGGIQQGTFLFVDVSGFTPLSERLSQFGRSGAEQVTNIINDLFFDMVSILFNHGGSLLKFGGDALLGLFPASEEAILPQTALHAAQTAIEMQAVMEKFAAIEAGGDQMALRIKCGISTGSYFAAHIGTESNMAYVTTGHTVNSAEQAEGNAEPGEIILAPSAYSLIVDKVEGETRNETYLLTAVKEIDQEYTFDTNTPIASDVTPLGDLQTQVTYLVDRLDRLTPYLAADLLPRMVNNPDNVQIAPDHRPVTVMFVNYRGISNLIEDMGKTRPEIITQQLNRYFCHMADIVEKYEGTLARMDQYAIGDRLVIFFGAPRAHEDDPVRAVYTALEMQAASREHFSALQTGKGIYRFDQRIGINTGHLFAGNVGASNLRQEYTLMGDDINMAARLMSKAEWETIFVSKKTQERVASHIELENKGSLKVKGKEILIPTFQVLRRRQETGPTRGLGSDSPLIGRRKELTALKEVGYSFLNGRGQILSIIGNSGLGKSRMKRELNSWIFGQTGRKKLNWFEGQSLSFSERVSNWLIIQLVQSSLGLSSEATKDDILFTLWQQSEALLGKETAREAVPFIAHLLRLQLEGEWAQWVEELEPRVRQKQTFWAIRQFFIAIARKKPTVIALEDLHWADEASLAIINDLLAISDQVPLMFCLIFREIRDKGCWQLRNNAAGAFPHRYVEVRLTPLSKANARRLLGRLLPGAKFSQETIDNILNKSAGNPYYLEEVVRSLIENEAVVPQPEQPKQWQVTEMIEQIAVPDTLQGAIVSRLDRLEEDVRQGLQMAAVIGRQFQANLLRGLSETDSEVDRWLSELERVGLIKLSESEQTASKNGAKVADLLDILIGDSPETAEGESEEQTYTFPDALVQEVAYDSMLVKRRKQFHRQVGEALEQLFAARLDEECEMLAYHFGRSDNLEKAIHYLEKAGKTAQAGFANETALEHYSNLLEHLENEQPNWQKQYSVLKARQQIYALIGEQDGREADIKTMIALAKTNQDESRLAEGLNALADLYQWTGRYDETIAQANDALAINEKIGQKAGQAEALHQIGVVKYYQGNYEEAQPALEQAASLRRFTNDPDGESWTELYLCMINFVIGNYGEAILHNERALQTAESRHDWLQMGIHLNNGARISHRLGQYQEALVQFRKSLEMRERVGDRTGQGFTLFGLGLIYIQMEKYDEAKSALQESLAIRQAIEDERGISYTTQGLGLVALGQNKLERAIEHFERAKDLHTKLNLKGELVADLSYLGQTYLKMGKLTEAAQLSGEAIELLAAHKNVEEIQQIYLNHYRVLSALEDPSADRYLQLASDAMITQAEAINDPTKRKMFLENVLVNQAITAEIIQSDWAVQTEVTEPQAAS